MPKLSVTEDRPYVSRGGIKLANALDTLGLDVTGLDCLDVGASTGGFTDCLLQRGASRVIALDVAHGQLEWSLRNDPRVEVIERTNARSITPRDLPFEPALATIDVSFISLTKVMPAVADCLAADGQLLAMVKPQFELGRARVKAGVVRAAEDRREALITVAEAASELGLAVRGFASSELPGPKGNRETFVWAARRGGGLDSAGMERAALRGRTVNGRAPGPGEVKTVALLSHTQPEQTAEAVTLAAELASKAGVELVAGEAERSKHSSAAEYWQLSRSMTGSPTYASSLEATARSSRHFASSRTRTCPCSASTTARSASWLRWIPRTSAKDSRAPSPATSRSCPCRRSTWGRGASP